MWGYLEPGGLKQSVSVASSGNTDLASLPNTAVGLQQAHITLRNKYAPNVILAGHVSTWSWNTSTNCSLNVASIAATDAAFMTGGNWDLYFTDIAFGDAGAPRGAWWDASNATCPNFNMLNIGRPRSPTPSKSDWCSGKHRPETLSMTQRTTAPGIIRTTGRNTGCRTIPVMGTWRAWRIPESSASCSPAASPILPISTMPPATGRPIRLRSTGIRRSPWFPTTMGAACGPGPFITIQTP